MAPDRLSLPLRLGLYGAALAIVLYLTQAPVRDLPPVSLWDKAEHALAWAALTACGLLLFPRRPGRIVLLVLAYGGLVEVVQALLPFGRDADWRDWAADAVGVGAALIALGGLRRLRA
jgi:VanZ family protein